MCGGRGEMKPLLITSYRVVNLCAREERTTLDRLVDDQMTGFKLHSFIGCDMEMLSQGYDEGFMQAHGRAGAGFYKVLCIDARGFEKSFSI